MKKVIIFFIILSASYYCSYSQSTAKIDKEKTKSEISLMEKNFQNDLVRFGVDNAFHKYAAENAVIKRENDTLVIGKQAIKNYYSNPVYKKTVAEWSPDYIDVSDDGSMAYTYGKYRWNFTDKEVSKLKNATTYACEEFMKVNSDWVHLRSCETCGVTLCCDNSPLKHMTAHNHATSHPVVISAEPGERWLWCYNDELFVEY